MKISIIIPCYSVGKELAEIAIDSIQRQTYSDWEIVFVNDNSPLQEWKSEKLNSIIKDKIKIIHNKENVGPGRSRNIGIDNSSGDLILFLDADDKYLGATFFQYLINKFEEYANLDMILFGNIRSANENKKIYKKNKEFYYQNINFDIFNKYVYKIGAWICLKKEFITKNNIRNLIEKTIISEDVCFFYQIIYHKPNLLYTTMPFYFWRKRQNSRTWNMSKDKNYEINNINIILNDINKLKLKKNIDDIYIYISRYLIVSLLKHGYKKNKKYLNIEINKILCKRLFKSVKNWHWAKVKFINRFKLKWLIQFLYRIYYFIK